MKYKHYAPKAEMIIVDGAQDAVIRKINELTAAKRAEGKKVAVIATDETKDRYDAQVILSMGKRADEDAIAQHLYKILRECDELDVGEIYSECFQTPRIGQAIMNRLLKHTQLQDTFGVIMLALVGGEPRILNIHDMLY